MTRQSRELYPIVHDFFRFNFLSLNSAKTVNIARDHSALRYILDPTLTKNKSHAQRLWRWPTMIQQVRTRVFHVPVSTNQFADLLSRWGYEDGDATVPSAEALVNELSQDASTGGN